MPTQERKRENIDHDLLITLNVKLDGVVIDMKEIKDGSASQLTNHELRIKTLEELTTKYPADQLVPQFMILQQEFHDQKLTSKERVRITAMVSAGVTFLLTTVATIVGILTGVVKLGAM